MQSLQYGFMASPPMLRYCPPDQPGIRAADTGAHGMYAIDCSTTDCDGRADDNEIEQGIDQRFHADHSFHLFARKNARANPVGVMARAAARCAAYPLRLRMYSLYSGGYTRLPQARPFELPQGFFCV